MATAKVISMTKFVKDTLGKGSESYIKTHRKEVYDIFADSLLKSVKNMTERSPVDTGLYASSWDVEKVDENNIFFGNTAPYATIIELGARPFRPPIGPILAWASRKLSLPEDHPRVRSFAFFVVKKIEKEGLEPHYIMENGLEEIIYPKIEIELKKLSK